MALRSINPYTGELLKAYEEWDGAALERTLTEVRAATPGWAATPMEQRCELLRRTAQLLRQRREEWARLATLEMGKRIAEARAEIDKCSLVCDFYAERGPAFLQDEAIDSDASRSLVAYEPLGTVLAIMPWNFPFWQVFRFAAPALIAGNTAVLKHASNVPQCALAIEAIFQEAGFPPGVFRTLLIGAGTVPKVIEDARIQAVTLTGSELAGRKVAALAGAALKKCVLELGGSDPFVVLEDADLDLAAHNAVASRFLNNGQSCIAAKRFIVVETVAEEFMARFKEGVEGLVPGDPLDEATGIGPMAREDLREELHGQVTDALHKGAIAVTGCEPLAREGAFYAPSILDRIQPHMRAYHEELFGPVALVHRARDEEHALALANDTPHGLGGSVWTEDTARGEALARQLECGCAFVNGMVKSDPRLPFGGIKASGFGRELAHHGIREFVNAKTLWIR